MTKARIRESSDPGLYVYLYWHYWWAQQNLRDWRKEEGSETSYNDNIANEHDDLLHLDTEHIKSYGDMVEVCDLLHADDYLTHIKKYEKSQTLSHLFSQGYASAVLLGVDEAYKKALVDFAERHSAEMGEVAMRSPQAVTYTIAFKKQGRGVTDLPTFSKVNLRDFAKRLTRLRVKPTVARIQIV
ncbi:DUF6119 family protein [Streptomyces sp. NPDC017056]|uniref:DUF6119 family protein n=1 Tax=Streptomyces sp. NPDC017056 TaxID=3364973 RepID=UPI00378D6464